MSSRDYFCGILKSGWFPPAGVFGDQVELLAWDSPPVVQQPEIRLSNKRLPRVIQNSYIPPMTGTFVWQEGKPGEPQQRGVWHKADDVC